MLSILLLSIFLLMKMEHMLITGRNILLNSYRCVSDCHHRRFFHFFTFFFLFYYALVGLFKAIQRVLISAVVNLFYLCRLDTALTIKGWEWLDKGENVPGMLIDHIL